MPDFQKEVGGGGQGKVTKQNKVYGKKPEKLYKIFPDVDTSFQ